MSVLFDPCVSFPSPFMSPLHPYRSSSVRDYFDTEVVTFVQKLVDSYSKWDCSSDSSTLIYIPSFVPTYIALAHLAYVQIFILLSPRPHPLSS